MVASLVVDVVLVVVVDVVVVLVASMADWMLSW